ncbi:MAG: metallophosphoesterase, partial [Candidatus Heimdallarchaeota archaeon]|nr:metallophosphoesterase [Candidatus Heimdallarchaeota archaeon]
MVKSKYTLFDIKSEIDLILADSRSILEFNKDELGIIINVWIDALRKKRMLVDINSDNVLVVGDIHGDLEQLQRALHLYDIGEVSKVVFNGDLIDRGPEMVECISLVMI